MLAWPKRLRCLLILALIVAFPLFANLRSLYEGGCFLYQAITWDPDAVKPVSPDGPYGLCHVLIRQTNAQRASSLRRAFVELGLRPILVPVEGLAQPNILVTLGGQGPHTLFVAHYDLSRETPTYQGASDNTAALCALIQAARVLAADERSYDVAILLTAGEERGFLGALALAGWMERNHFPVQEVINLDMIGRGGLATRPSAWPGLYIWVPGVGQMVFDGERFHRASDYPQPDTAIVARLENVMGRDLIHYERFAVYSDSNVFQDLGLPTVSISSSDMFYLNLVWEKDADRIELLDERNLDLAVELIIGYARSVGP
jgi:Zn-dependent M28 family amino/carboxypeptidase